MCHLGHHCSLSATPFCYYSKIHHCCHCDFTSSERNQKTCFLRYIVAIDTRAIETKGTKWTFMRKERSRLSTLQGLASEDVETDKNSEMGCEARNCL